MSHSQVIGQEPRTDHVSVPVLFVALPLSVAVATTLGSLWLSMGMDLKACPLCFYQRTFAMSVLGVLAIGLLAGTQYRNVLNLLALPLAAGGFGVAAFHVYLELNGKLECPLGVAGIGTAPQQSLAVFILLLACVALGAAQSKRMGGPGLPPAIAAAILGGLLTIGAVKSTPPMPDPPSQPYPAAPKVCRPPFPG